MPGVPAGDGASCQLPAPGQVPGARCQQDPVGARERVDLNGVGYIGEFVDFLASLFRAAAVLGPGCPRIG